MSRLFASLPGDEGLPGPQRRGAVAVVMIGTTMGVLDATITNIGLPTIARDLHATAAEAIWVVNAYQLTTASCIVALAALGDVVGYRRVYWWGLVAFTLASLACALAPSLELLVVFRVLQGLGAAAVMSVGPALYRAIFPTRLLGAALGLSALTVAASATAGPMISGFILAVLNWPWLFAINLPIGLFAVVLGTRTLPPNAGRGGRFDVAGAIFAGSAMGAFVVGMDGLAKHAAPTVIGLLLATSVAAGAAFVVRQRVVSYPLLPLGLFSSPRFSLAAVASLCSFVSQGLVFVTVPFLFQDIYGYTPLMSGLLFMPWPMTIIVAAPVAGRLADRISPRILSTAGLIVLAGGLVTLATLGSAPGIPDLLWRASLCGLGFGFFQSPNNRELLGSVPRSLSGAASGVLASARTFGQSLGAALTAIVLAVPAGGQVIGKAVAPSQVHLSLWLACAAAAGASLISALRITSGRMHA
jgi:DHA2 family multidrug resistance protein-like MFS transporter